MYRDDVVEERDIFRFSQEVNFTNKRKQVLNQSRVPPEEIVAPFSKQFSLFYFVFLFLLRTYVLPNWWILISELPLTPLGYIILMIEFNFRIWNLGANVCRENFARHPAWRPGLVSSLQEKYCNQLVGEKNSYISSSLL